MADLSPKAQYWYGVGGGFLSVVGVLMSTHIGEREPWPDFTEFSTCFHVGKWLLFPFAAGLASRLCEPRHMLAAAYEGVSTLGLFYLLAKHVPH